MEPECTGDSCSITGELPPKQQPTTPKFVRGRLVKTLVRGVAPAGVGTVAWDGTDEEGCPVGSGAYICRLGSAAGEATRRFVFVRQGGGVR